MSFTQAGSVITQSASPANFATLNGMTGVTYQTSGRVTIINLGTNRIDFNGTVNHVPEELVLVCNAPCSSAAASVPFRLLSGTVYNYGVARVAGSATTYSQGAGIILTANGVNTFNSKSLQVESGATLNWNGGDIHVGGVYEFVSGSTVTQNAGGFINLNPTQECQLRLQAFSQPNKDQHVFNRLKLDGIDRAVSLFTTLGVGVGVFELANAFLQNPNFSYTNPVLFTDLNNVNNRSAKDYLFGSTDPTFINAIVTIQNAGKRLTAVEAQVNNTNGYIEVRRQVSVNVRDDAGAAIAEFSYYAVDTNNGARRVGVNNIANRTANLEYTANNASSLSANLLVEVIDCNEAAAPTVNVDDRTNANGTIPISILAFGKEVVTVEPEAYGLGTQSITATALPDFSVTAATKAEVLAYTAADTPATAYDLAHVFRLDNFQLYRPKIVTLTANGLLDLNGYNVVIDATAAQVFNFDGSTVTLKAAAFPRTNLTNAGTVTYANGATGSLLSFSGVDAWTVYPTEADRDANTNALATGTGSDVFNFAYVPATTYWLRLTTNGETLLKAVTPAAAGETQVELTTASLLNAISASTASIDVKLGYLPPIVFFDAAAPTNGDGSTANPFNSAADAITQARAINADEISMRSSMTLPASAAGVNFSGQRESLVMDLNGQDIDGALIEQCVVVGACTAGDGAQLRNVIVGFPGLGGVSGFTGIIRDFVLKNDLGITGNVTLANGGTELTESITITLGPNSVLAAAQFTGNVTISGVTAGCVVDFNSFAGTVTVDASCTGGTINVRGRGASVIDNSTGAVVTDETGINAQSIRDAVGLSAADLDAQLADARLKATEVWKMHGLELGNPLTVTPTSRQTADESVVQALSGDGEATTTVTRA